MLINLASLEGKTVLAFSAHCDDVAIGCAGLLRRIMRDTKAKACLRAVTFCGGDDSTRGAEERHAMTALGCQEQTILSFPDTQLPENSLLIKKEMLDIRDRIGEREIGLILCPRLEDRHQDHRAVAENIWRVFRLALIVEYEIAKYEADLGSPNVYVRLGGEDAAWKVELLLSAYPSRKRHHWWSAETFYALMRLRGVECNSPFAEGMYCRKLAV
ncbi:PIG-L family deacetylase [Accumulibacter sp.]|uniref:PIG-L deacetylase family protein n=1 Tax=Accumulibacter sp. TaxID=2053492 RepID=UPI00260F95D2|nr:PIG-L family deacetylase [Accumulibacter sp.]